MPAPERTTTATIITAGREILERAGQAGLTMQAVATQVGVRPPSLYKRVRDRDALLTAVAEATIAELTERLDATARLHSADETPRNPDEVIRAMQSHHGLGALADELRAFAHEHPEGFRLMFTASAPLGALDRAARPVIAASAALVGDDDALNAARMFTAWATGFLQMELTGAFRLGGDVDGAFEYGRDRLIYTLTGASRER